VQDVGLKHRVAQRRSQDKRFVVNGSDNAVSRIGAGAPDVGLGLAARGVFGLAGYDESRI
jgi:hypothetical protein